jgi:hypothetical protein
LQEREGSFCEALDSPVTDVSERFAADDFCSCGP